MGAPARFTRLHVAVLALMSFSACTSVRLRPPPRPQPTAETRHDLRGADLYVPAFTVAHRDSGGSEPVSRTLTRRFRARFLQYLVRRLDLGNVFVGRSPEPEARHALVLEADLVAWVSPGRGGDSTSAGLLGGGLAIVEGEVVVRSAADRLVERLQLREEVPYADDARRSAALTDAFAGWFEACADRLTLSGPRLAVLAGVFEAPRAASPATAPNPTDEPGTETSSSGLEVDPQPDPLSGAALATSQIPIVTDPFPSDATPTAVPETLVVDGQEIQIYDGEPPPLPDHVRRITETPPRRLDRWYNYLSLLGGLEVQGFYGQATVSSSVRHDGEKVKVAEGEATRQGVRVQLYSAPSRSGLFILPNLGYMLQRIDIHDFEASLPPTSVAEGIDIPSTCTTVDGGTSCEAANTYSLLMQSGYLGAVGGADLVVGKSTWEYFLSVALTANVVEYRDIRVRLGNHRERAGRFDFFRSGGASINTGFRFPKAHVGFRVAGSYEHFFEFKYAKPIEFMGPVVFDPTVSIYRRTRSFVSAASLGSFSGQVALDVLF